MAILPFGSRPGPALPVSIANGGTGQTTDAAAFQALGLGVMTAAGDMVRRTTVNTIARLAIGSAGRILGVSGSNPTWQAQSYITHANISGLTADDHTQYALLAGRSGGQTLIGGTGASENLVLTSTANATKGLVYTSGNFQTGSTAHSGIGTTDAAFNGRVVIDPTGAGASFDTAKALKIYHVPNAEVSGIVDFTVDISSIGSGAAAFGTNRVIQAAISGIPGFSSGTIQEVSALYLNLGFGIPDGVNIGLLQAFTLNGEWLDLNSGSNGITEAYGGGFGMGGSALNFNTPTKKATKIFGLRININNRYSLTGKLGAIDIQEWSGTFGNTVDTYASINQDVSVMDTNKVADWSFIRFTQTPTNPTGNKNALYFSSTLASVHAGRMMFGSTTQPSQLVELEETETITGAVTDGYAAGLRLDPGYTAATAQTVTRHNYIDVQNVSTAGAGPAAVTDAAVLRFDAAAGTHKAVAGTGGGVAVTIGDGPTGSTAGNPLGWIKVNVNGTLRYVPFW